MLYVFHVDAGLMTTYDMNLTLQSVASLKAAIERKTKIPAHSLVLLVSGGEVLQSDHMVSSYSAGTDTNPIYMFSKPSVKESHIKQSMCGDLSPIVELSTGEFRSDSSAFDGKSVAELRKSVEVCCSMQPNVNTVMSCATLAKQFSDLAHEVSRSCEQLVHEQHLQHQGWAAVVANLEDIFNEFCERSRSFKESFKKHRIKKEEYHEMLNTLNEVLESLGKIPILSALQLHAEAHRFSAFDVFEETDFEGHHYGSQQRSDTSSENRTAQDFGVGVFKLSDEDVFDQKNASGSNDEAPAESHQIEESDEGVTFKAPSIESKEEPTLLHWILAQGNKASLQDILDYCQKALALIDAEPLKEREAQLYQILEYANMHGLKQIKGIEDRLYGLDQLLNDVKKLEKDQRDQATSIIQCRDRLNSACDPTVLPTLVQSHCCQLEKLLVGHQKIVDIIRRIAKSKEELSQVLKARLEAVLRIENSMSVQDAHAMLSFQCLNRLSRYFGIVWQLHRAPRVFVRAVHEVARRRTFSHAHLQWATDLAEKLLKIHEEEVSRREEFNTLFEGHFLKSLFPGMTDLPPTFATQAPPTFDSKLPKLTNEDVEFVSSAFPELAKDVPKYDMDSTVKFFQQRLSTSHHGDKDVNVQVDLDRDFESDTDFEKLARQSVARADAASACAPDIACAATVTEVLASEGFVNSEFYIDESLASSLEWGRGRQDNMDTHKINIEKLQDFLTKLCTLCKVNIVLIKEELTKLKNDMDEQKRFMQEKFLEITKAWSQSNEEIRIRFREEKQRLTVDHELELSDMKATLSEKDELIETLKREKEELKNQHQKDIERLEAEHKSTKDLLEQTRGEIKVFENKLEDAEVQKAKEIKEVQEKMHLEYKAEIESMRSRFRLVALTNNMDRSPSESSLEKIERTDVIEISHHNAIVMQTKENAEVEKDQAIKDTVEKCKVEWEQKLNAEIALLKAKYEAEKQVTINDVTRRLLIEKDRQLELLREREQALTRECSKYRDTIQQLTDPETNDYDSLLKTQFATLENEKALLQQQVADLKKELEKRGEEGEKSREDDSDGRSSPKKEEGKRSRTRCHTPVGLSAGALSLSSCLPGHTVLLLWDPAHLNYTVLQEASIMYFVHSDCLAALDLSIHVKNESERRLYAIATVESKEFCYAKKSGNRYQMPRGSKFYRVRVKPLKPHPPHPSCCDHRHKQDALKGSVLNALEARPLKKWLTYMHATDTQKSVDTSQSTSSATDEASRVGEVATATLINLESPVSCEITPAPPQSDLDQLDSIESSEQWQSAKMQVSTASALTDMECSVGRCPGPEPLELTVSSVSVVARGSAPPGSELAEEATP
ncbi:RB1-inducible coiled-coil protein 1 isoform X1 [Zerene cesonia]|uniref:RB1-inducible coiled-coil protein 1 isoform X1 n=1 Tax=Zerene cesonia TaxID=33412 RepID=UPI0018E549FE|nr:RB1-inducible coiled-coil protein 1 isoform X1 [Zerene cesonia]